MRDKRRKERKGKGKETKIWMRDKKREKTSKKQEGNKKERSEPERMRAETLNRLKCAE